MIKVDFSEYIKDRMWFGFYYRITPFDPTAVRLGETNWFYSNWWTLRLWPKLEPKATVPSWWMAIFDYFGYAKDYEEGVE
jgi:hypothetical protein